MEYSCEGSGAWPENAISFLKNYGYQGGNKMEYDYNTVIASLNNWQPVMANGFATKITTVYKFLGITYRTTTTYRSGHTWVIDGYLNKRRYVQKIAETWNRNTSALISTTTTGYYEYWNLLHNNWGWNNNKNGYFTQGSFDSNNMAENSATKGTEGNYQFKKEIFPYIRH
jgi:hypothetical protein